MRLLRSMTALALTVLLASSAGSVLAQNGLEQARQEREQVRRERAAAAAQLDVSRAADAEVAAALADLTAQVSAQQGLVEDARRQLAAAEEARIAAEERVVEAVQAQDGLRDQLRERAVAGFVGEGLNDAALLLSVEHPNEALRRTALMASVQADTANVLEDFRALEEDRVVAQAQADAAQREAAELQEHLSRVLDDLQQQRQAQAALKAEMERRVQGWQAQVAAFTQEEQELTAYIQAEVAAAEARRRAAEEEARRRAAEEEARRQAAAEQARQVEDQRQRSASEPATGTASAPSGGSGPSQGEGASDGGERSAEADASPPPRAGASSSGWQWPVSGRVTSGYGYRVHPIFGTSRLHAGLDITGGTGTPIRAARSGTILFSGWRNGYGNTVMILHDGGVVSLYAHQSRTAVSNGDTVSGGELIGYVGSTGWSTGPHLHFEIRVNGSAVDPRPYLP